MTAHPGIKDQYYYNFIAQEFATVFPNAVQGSGEYLSDGSEILQLDSYNANIVAIKAIQEQQTQIVSLQSIMTDFIAQFKAGLIETKKLIVDGVDILKKLNELSDKSDKQEKTIEAQQKQIDELKRTIDGRR